MRALIAAVILILTLTTTSAALAGPIARGPLPRGAMVAADAISVAVVPLPNGAVIEGGLGAAVADLGTVSANAGRTRPGVDILSRARSYVVTTTIGLRVDSIVGGSVSLQGFLDAQPNGIIVRIDGVVMTPMIQTFARRVAVGAVTAHRIEVEIPSTLPVAQVPAEIPLEFGAIPD
ncbi:MAG: hypothetical protein JO101_06460 [Candidatus Eremiobacteraeota bacterium]|nr:hypothetical protein [Candidatus Eremiobacteraeota bacterium]